MEKENGEWKNNYITVLHYLSHCITIASVHLFSHPHCIWYSIHIRTCPLIHLSIYSTTYFFLLHLPIHLIILSSIHCLNFLLLFICVYLSVHSSSYFIIPCIHVSVEPSSYLSIRAYLSVVLFIQFLCRTAPACLLPGVLFHLSYLMVNKFRETV